jgi:hypothetical protein
MMLVIFYLFVSLWSAFLIPGAHGLIDDPVSQRTYIKNYQPSVMYEHTFFDMSILDSTSLVQADF